MDNTQKNVTLTINDVSVTVPEGTTIIEAARKIGIDIPSLCYYRLDECHVRPKVGSCRICVVEVKGRPNLVPSCACPVEEGMVVQTNTPRVVNARRTNLELLLSDHPFECLLCKKNGDCELQDLAARFEIREIRYQGKKTSFKEDFAMNAIHRDPNKCVMCRRCETACNVLQTVGVLSGTERGFESVVDTFNHNPLATTQCTFCGQCVAACPTGAITAINQNHEILNALYDPKKIVVAQVAPAVRVALGELFGMPPGSITTGKLVAALKAMKFDYVFDTNWAADLTIMEEAHEFVERVKNNGKLPILTSCCPGWVNFLEYQFPDLIDVPSSAKSPQQMFGAVAKHLWAKKMGFDRKDVVVVSIMPCVAKKYEAARPEFAPDGIPDVDYVMTTREFGTFIKECGINFDHLQDMPFDSPLGASTGAAVIFGAAGGVLEAALRTAYTMMTGEELENVDFKDVRGISGIQEAEIDIKGQKIRVAQASSLGNARRLLEKVRKGEVQYHAIEIMACPGGCINGGGQPYIHGNTDIIKARQQAIYEIDKNMPIRKSHQNPEVQAIYKEFLGHPGSELAHKLLHTHYTPKKPKCPGFEM